MGRCAEFERVTGETRVKVRLDLDGQGEFAGCTGIGFLDHMLQLLARHARFDLVVEAQGDLEVDPHHTVEDVAICLGQALSQAVGDKIGINRFGSALLPMDEALVLVSLDLSGRAYLSCKVPLKTQVVGDFPVEMLPDFMRALANNAGMNLHLRRLAGENTHHIIEALFKGLARALRQAVTVREGEAGVPSTKGLL
jgi:imidazoleglycerol-phosphate dehydratase